MRCSSLSGCLLAGLTVLALAPAIGVPGAAAIAMSSTPAANGSWTQLGSGLNNLVLAFAKGSDDTIYLGGGFTADNSGTTLTNIAAWSPTQQSFSPLGNGLDNSVQDMVMSPDDTLYIGGFFANAVGGLSLSRIAAWSPQTSTYSALGAGLNNYVNSLDLDDDTLFIGGGFTSFGGGPANQLNRIAQWGPVSGGGSYAPVGNGVNFAVDVVYAPPGDDSLYAAGSFSQEVGGVANSLRYITQWGPIGSSAAYAPVGTGMNNLTFAIESTSDDSIVLGGQFTSTIGGTPLRNVALWKPGSTSDAGYVPLGFGLENRVDDIAIDDSRSLIYVVGLFDFACGDASCSAADDDTVPLNGVAVFDRRTQSWSPMSDGDGVGVGPSAFVNALLLDGSSLYVGGSFTQTGGGAPLVRAARWDWSPPSGSAIISGSPGAQVDVAGSGLIGVNSVTVGGVAAAIDYSASSGTSLSITIPSGLGPGSHPIIADAVGGIGTIGTFVAALPTPPPPTPSDPPSGVNAVAKDAAAIVTWSAPSFSGSYAVTNYLVTSSPGGRTCLTSTTSCTVTGLVNETSYTFTVRALTGAGWSPASAASNVVVPRTPTIVISGSRDGRVVSVAGSSSGLGMGAILRPWVRVAGRSSFTEGSARILVSMDGSFEWSRRVARGVSVYVATPDGVLSNRVIIPAK